MFLSDVKRDNPSQNEIKRSVYVGNPVPMTMAVWSTSGPRILYERIKCGYVISTDEWELSLSSSKVHVFFHIWDFYDVIMSTLSSRPKRLSRSRRHCEVSTTTFLQAVSRVKLFSFFFSLLFDIRSMQMTGHVRGRANKKHHLAHFLSYDMSS